MGELRSLIPTGVNMVELTATATEETLDIVSRRLCMVNPIVVALPPYRDNITYQVCPKIDLDTFTTLLCSELNTKRLVFPKTIVYIRTYTKCIEMYTAIKSKLGIGFTEPPGYPNISGYRIVDMYTRVLTADKKEEVMPSFSKIGGSLRLVLATTAFGMGVDIIHWGCQVCTGRHSVAIAYEGNQTKNASFLVKEYGTHFVNAGYCFVVF